MASVKTAISLPELLFQRADVVAHRLEISRSQLIARAVEWS
jgi:metal-responsive CopG/Arc/MetJ family transcriptional regulator